MYEGDNIRLLSILPEVTDIPCTEIPDTIPVKTSTDWQAAFGFGQSTKLDQDWQDDDLGMAFMKSLEVERV